MTTFTNNTLASFTAHIEANPFSIPASFTYETTSYTIKQDQTQPDNATTSVTVYYRINDINYTYAHFPHALCIIQPDIFGNTYIYIDIPHQHIVWQLFQPSSPLKSTMLQWQPIIYC